MYTTAVQDQPELGRRIEAVKDLMDLVACWGFLLRQAKPIPPEYPLRLETLRLEVWPEVNK